MHHNLSFVQYNVQSIVNKLDILQAELHDIDILSFTETWLSPDISTEDIILQSYNKLERKDRPEDPHGGVIIYVKDGIHYKRRDDLEVRGIESIWIELIHNRKSILYGVFYRPPESDSQYLSNIEDSIALAIDTDISDVIITGDFNFNYLKYKYKYKYICIAQNCIMKYSVALYTVPLVIEFILSIIEFFKQMSFQFASETCFICTCFNVIW